MSKNKVVLGLVDAEIQAESVVQKLQNDGFASSDISAIFPDKSGTKEFAHEHNTKAPEGALVGVASGGALGGTIVYRWHWRARIGLGVHRRRSLMAALSGAAAARRRWRDGRVDRPRYPEPKRRLRSKLRGTSYRRSVDDSEQEKRAKESEARGRHAFLRPARPPSPRGARTGTYLIVAEWSFETVTRRGRA